MQIIIYLFPLIFFEIQCPHRAYLHALSTTSAISLTKRLPQECGKPHLIPSICKLKGYLFHLILAHPHTLPAKDALIGVKYNEGMAVIHGHLLPEEGAEILGFFHLHGEGQL